MRESAALKDSISLVAAIRDEGVVASGSTGFLPACFMFVDVYL